MNININDKYFEEKHERGMWEQRNKNNNMNFKRLRIYESHIFELRIKT